MSLNFYGVIIFAPPGHFSDWRVQVPLFLTMLVPFLAWLTLLRNLSRDKLSLRQKQRLRRTVIYSLLVMTVYLIGTRTYDLITMLWPAGVWFLFSAIMIGLCAGRIHTLDRESAKINSHEAKTIKKEDVLPKDHHLRIWFMAVSAILICFFLFDSFCLWNLPVYSGRKRRGRF